MCFNLNVEMPAVDLIPVMDPPPGERFVRYVGDRIRFVLRDLKGRVLPDGWEGRLRTTIGRATQLRKEIIMAHSRGVSPGGIAWRDIPMRRHADHWEVELWLTEPGFFKAKAYVIDPRGWQHWPEGPDVGISVHPNEYRTANTIYCAFPRLFGPKKHLMFAKPDPLGKQIDELEKHGYTVIPPSGKLRELKAYLGHIITTLGCRILHLLPITPTPTTYARFGRFGSPYASIDLIGIDPSLIEFDRRTTGVEQFMELAGEVHARGGRLFLDLAINHTGWEATLMRDHPEWFQRTSDGTFISPGAWGVIWEDLVELKHDNVALWDELVEVFLTWCRRGVDGFRCDAGYKVPVNAWQYIIACVQEEFPNTVFLLEGLGGPWETTELLLTEGGMQWAYSELFQNYSGPQVAWYLDYALRQSQRVGVYVHYAETHDNNRLALGGKQWSLLRTRLCGLTSVGGAFGFTCGVEWLAKEKIDVHDITGLAWGNPDNIVAELAALNRLLSEHPCFFDGAELVRLSPHDSPVYILRRVSADRQHCVLVVVNTDVDHEHTITLDQEKIREGWLPNVELLGQPLPPFKVDGGRIVITVPPGWAGCLSNQPLSNISCGDEYRRKRAVSAWALSCAASIFGPENVHVDNPFAICDLVDHQPAAFLSALTALKGPVDLGALENIMEKFRSLESYPSVVVWQVRDTNRVLMVPVGFWLMIEDIMPFRVTLDSTAFEHPIHLESVRTRAGFICSVVAPGVPARIRVLLERYESDVKKMEAEVLVVDPGLALPTVYTKLDPDSLVLLTNGRGGMSRMRVDLGRVLSKYDCVLGANFSGLYPTDPHIFCSRLRAWVNADGFLSQLSIHNLIDFRPGPPAVWHFIANAGDGRRVGVQLIASMIPETNTVVFRFERENEPTGPGALPPQADVRLTVRLDLEDRNFHFETHWSAELDERFRAAVKPLFDRPGFVFEPGPGRSFRAWSSSGIYHPQPEWSHVTYPVEAERGLIADGDVFSPGWFELPLMKGEKVTLVLTCDPGDPSIKEVERVLHFGEATQSPRSEEEVLKNNMNAYIVRRGTGRSVIAGYPWFLDWGRDALIFARGLIAAGRVETAKEIVMTFAQYEYKGTLPNNFAGEQPGNRDTSDAPLWLGVVCEELYAKLGENFLYAQVSDTGRTVLDVLVSIVENYLRGTPNGIHVDPESGLVWSPGHFTWMDTNYPACTPREGYPIEIQALWIKLLQFLGRLPMLKGSATVNWAQLASRAIASFERLFWLEDTGWYADVLVARPGQKASEALPDDALRPNFLIPISLGVAYGSRAKKAILAAHDYLLIPGALRSLAPIRLRRPLEIRGVDGALVGDPYFPYRGRYEGPEDTCRKPAYHNGTGWCWLLPVFCECLVKLWPNDKISQHAARCYLASVEIFLREGCLGHIPEICDGDAPHQARGCDAQAWSISELVRVWNILHE